MIDEPITLGEKQSRARKRQMCDGCAAPILPGQDYIATAVRESDYVITYRYHADSCAQRRPAALLTAKVHPCE